MTGRALKKIRQGAVATGATATGAASLAALAMGAMALGAVAVGALAVGRLNVGRARLRRVEIGELSVGRLQVGAKGVAGGLAVCHIRALPGKGDAFQHLVQEAIAGRWAAASFRAHRSRSDPDSFLFFDVESDDEPEPRVQDLRFDALVRRAAEQGIVSNTADDPAKFETYAAIG